MMAREASAQPLGERAGTARRTPSAMRSIGRFTPMTPVEQTATSSGGNPRASAASSDMRRAFASPVAPVQALAKPVLTATARRTPPFTRSRSSRTGAAAMAFVVKTPAQAAGESDTRRAKSLRFGYLTCASTPAARNPRGKVIPPSTFFSEPISHSLVFLRKFKQFIMPY